MQDCYIVRRGGSGTGSRVKPDYFKGLIQLEGVVNPEEVIGQNVVREPYASDVIQLYNFTNSSTEEDKEITLINGTNLLTIPYMGEQVEIENVGGAGIDGYYESDGYSILKYGLTEDMVVPTGVTAGTPQDFYLRGILASEKDELLVNKRDILMYKKESGKALCGIIYRRSCPLPFLIAKNEDSAKFYSVNGSGWSGRDASSIQFSFYYNDKTYYLGEINPSIYQVDSWSSKFYNYGQRADNNIKDSQGNDLNIPSLGGLVFQMIDLFGDYLEEEEQGGGE